MVGTNMILYECNHFGNKVVFYVFFPVCRLGAPRLKKGNFHNMILPGLVTGDNTILPRGLNMIMRMVELRIKNRNL
ncbi:hypothetical protein I3843_Q024400 [Carya illinoinensis]|nr:hypothetical protein I3843_Q024400 [Carya illinoinensis]